MNENDDITEIVFILLLFAVSFFWFYVCKRLGFLE